MNTEIKKQLSVLELSDLAAVIEAQEKEVSFVDLTYNEAGTPALSFDHRTAEQTDHQADKEFRFKMSQCKP